jgi:hypothetical protein
VASFSSRENGIAASRVAYGNSPPSGVRPLAPGEDAPVRKLGQGFGYSFRAHTALYLSPLIQFSVRLYIPNPPVLTTPLDFYVILDGLRGYPVQ